MKTLLASVFALGVMTSAASAEEPTLLADDQMDNVTAGQLIGPITVVDAVDVNNNNIQAAIPVTASVNVCAVVDTCTPVADADNVVNQRALQ